jgi:Peptidase family M50
MIWFLCMFAAIVAHEAGHALGAMACGIPFQGVVLGMGKLLWQGQWHGLFLRLRLWPLAVGVMVQTPCYAWQTRIIALAGPLTGLPLIALSFILRSEALFAWALLVNLIALLTPLPMGDGWQAVVAKDSLAEERGRCAVDVAGAR